MIEIKYPLKPFRVSMERPWCRRILERMMEKENKTLWELACTHTFLGRNIKSQMIKMLYEAGYSPSQIEEVMKNTREKTGRKNLK